MINLVFVHTLVEPCTLIYFFQTLIQIRIGYNLTEILGDALNILQVKIYPKQKTSGEKNMETDLKIVKGFEYLS